MLAGRQAAHPVYGTFSAGVKTPYDAAGPMVEFAAAMVAAGAAEWLDAEPGAAAEDTAAPGVETTAGAPRRTAARHGRRGRE